MKVYALLQPSIPALLDEAFTLQQAAKDFVLEGIRQESSAVGGPDVTSFLHWEDTSKGTCVLKSPDGHIFCVIYELAVQGASQWHPESH
jgi:hypothetical protein